MRRPFCFPRNVIDDSKLRNKTAVFADRREAGVMLSEKLEAYSGGGLVVMAIPSGGIPVGIEISSRLGGEFCLVPVRKLVIPFEPEAGFGALTWDGEIVVNEDLVGSIGLGRADKEESIRLARQELERRMKKFGMTGELPDVSGKKVIMVDDGLASGYTMLAALRATRRRGPSKAVVAVPTASLAALRMIACEATRVYCLNVRSGAFFAVADAYQHWHDLSDEEVLQILQEASAASEANRRR